MMLSTSAWKGDCVLATRSVKGPARAMSFASLGSDSARAPHARAAS